MKHLARFASVVSAMLAFALGGASISAAQVATSGSSGQTSPTGTSSQTDESEADEHEGEHSADHDGEVDAELWHDDYDCVEPTLRVPKTGEDRDPAPRPDPDAELTAIFAKIEAMGDYPSLVFHREPKLPHRWIRVGVRPDFALAGVLPDGRQYVDVALNDATVRICTGEFGTADAAWAPPGTPWLYVGNESIWGVEVQKNYFVTDGGDGVSAHARLVDVAATTGWPSSIQLDRIAVASLAPETQASMANDGDCEARAIADLGGLTAHMPTVYFPKLALQNCTAEDHCFLLKRAWLLVHHHAWRSSQMLNFIDSRPQSAHFYWSREGLDGFGYPPTSAYRLSDWFGKNFATHRYDAVQKIAQKLWIERTIMNQVNGFPLQLMCPDPANIGDFCFTATPSAHHGVLAQVAICDKGWEKYGNDPQGFARLLIHEMGHHLWFWWKPGSTWLLNVLADNHTHKHGANCKSDSQTEHMKSFEKAFHLGNYSYDGTPKADCGHRDIAVGNTDSHARWMAELGGAVYSGELHVWPQPPPKSTNGACNQHPQPGGGALGPDHQNNPCKGPKGENLCEGLVGLLGALEGGAIHDTDCILAK